MVKIIINAEGYPAGRISSFAAKTALGGDEVAVINSEKAIISGNKETTIARAKEVRAKGGSALKGPHHSKDPEKRLKRSIRGMLPDYRNGRGRDAWKKIRCYNGIPEEFKDAKTVKLNFRTPVKNMTLSELKEKL